MENNINQGLSGTHQNQASFMLVGGWKSSNCSPLPVEGEIFSLTFPFIDQAIALIDLVRGGIPLGEAFLADFQCRNQRLRSNIRAVQDGQGRLGAIRIRVRLH
jgi:hypothetical protein